MIPSEGSDESKRPPPPVPEAADDETFEDRLRHAIVRHFRFSWSELTQVRRAAREKPESETIAAAEPDAGAHAAAEPAVGSVNAPPSSPEVSAEAAPPPPPGGNGSRPARSDETRPTLPPDRPPF